MIEFVKWVGLTLIAMVLLAIPAMFVLSIIFNGGILLIITLGCLVGAEMFLIILAIEALIDEDVL